MRMIPFFKQSSTGLHNFFLIHAIQFENESDNPNQLFTSLLDHYVYLLISHEKGSMLNRYFDKNSFIKNKIVIKIYPPWYETKKPKN